MARTHEVPNRLNVEDTLFLGLTSRQVATFIAFASPAYGLYDQLTVAPIVVRAALAVLILTIGIAFTFIQPGGRPLDEWGFAVLAYLVTPRRLGWRRAEPDIRDWRVRTPSGWVDLAPDLGWSTRAGAFDDGKGDRNKV
jgi:hypothetical protein